MTVDMLCDCTHPKGGHAGLAYACWTCDCKRYTPDIQTAAILAKAKTMPTDSASAQLRRVQQERDEAKTQCRRLNRELDDVVTELVSARAELDLLRAQLAERGAP